MLVLTDAQRITLKRPLGRLVADDMITKELLSRMTFGASLVVAVGDATTRKMIDLCVRPDIEIVDGIEQRAPSSTPDVPIKNSLACYNKPGTLSDESLEVVRAAMGSAKPVRITVDGEEDLLVLPVCDMCPDGAVVAYGQPNEGMVVIRIDPTVRDKARAIMVSMEHRDDETVAE